MRSSAAAASASCCLPARPSPTTSVRPGTVCRRRRRFRRKRPREREQNARPHSWRRPPPPSSCGRPRSGGSGGRGRVKAEPCAGRLPAVQPSRRQLLPPTFLPPHLVPLQGDAAGASGGVCVRAFVQHLAPLLGAAVRTSLSTRRSSLWPSSGSTVIS